MTGVQTCALPISNRVFAGEDADARNAKALKAAAALRAELVHPIGGGFGALLPVATMVAGISVRTLMPGLSEVMLVAGIAVQVAYAGWFVGRAWTGGRPAETVTPALYLPSVGGFFVSAMAAAALGFGEAGVMAFGAGIVSWIVIEAVLWQRLLLQPPLPPAMRSSMGIHLAPPAVGLVAWEAVGGGGVDTVGLMLFGYALFQALVTLGLLPWLVRQPFSATWWAYSFAVTALPTGAMRLAEGGSPIASLLAPALFLAANLILAGLIVRSAMALAQGSYLPPAPVSAPDPRSEEHTSELQSH